MTHATAFRPVDAVVESQGMQAGLQQQQQLQHQAGPQQSQAQLGNPDLQKNLLDQLQGMLLLLLLLQTLSSHESCLCVKWELTDDSGCRIAICRKPV